MYTKENITRAVEETQRRTGQAAPSRTLAGTNKDLLGSARAYTKQALKAPVKATDVDIRAANMSQLKLGTAGTVGAGSGVGAGMLTGGNQE